MRDWVKKFADGWLYVATVIDLLRASAPFDPPPRDITVKIDVAF